MKKSKQIKELQEEVQTLLALIKNQQETIDLMSKSLPVVTNGYLQTTPVETLPFTDSSSQFITYTDNVSSIKIDNRR